MNNKPSRKINVLQNETFKQAIIRIVKTKYKENPYEFKRLQSEVDDYYNFPNNRKIIYDPIKETYNQDVIEVISDINLWCTYKV